MKRLLPQYLNWERDVVFGKANASVGLDLSSFVNEIKIRKKNNIDEARLEFASLFLRMSVDLIGWETNEMSSKKWRNLKMQCQKHKNIEPVDFIKVLEKFCGIMFFLFLLPFVESILLW